LLLSREREQIALGNNLNTIVRRVIQAADRESWSAELLKAARAADPHNVALFTFSQQFGLAPATTVFERTIRKSIPTFDPEPWRKRLAELEPRVCRVELMSSFPPDYGTGFLLGPNLVMTNYHVVKEAIGGSVRPDEINFRFDYKVMDDGVEVNPGTIYHLQEVDWLVDASPPSEFDGMVVPTGEPTNQQLDYALLRLEGEPGEDPVGGPEVEDTNAPARGWIPVPAGKHTFEPNSPLMILQHPDGAPVKLAMDTQAVIGLNKNKSRVRYTTNTEGGSSGSPCFDLQWNLIALHHMGDPNYAREHMPEFNQGIPLAAILERLGNKRDLLGDS
jgi:hypothetical protein